MISTDEFISRIGIDRTVVSNFRITEIDFERLLMHENVTVDAGVEHGYVLEDGSSFRFLKIADGRHFGVMCAGVKVMKHMKQEYSRLDITVGSESQGNLQSRNVAEYFEKISLVFQYLREQYGVVVELSELKFSEIEINCTIPIEEEFHKYHRPLRLLMFNLPKCFKKLGQIGDVNKQKASIETETFYRGHKTTEIKIYDKKRQLQQVKKVDLDTEYMRIEISLKNRAKIKEVFGTALVKDLTDEKVNRFFIRQFERLFVKSYRKWEIQNERVLRKLIQEHKEKNIKFWKVNLLRECSNVEQCSQIPILLDVGDLLAEVKKLEKHGHYKRVAEGFLALCEENDVYLQKDSDKIEEIFEKVYGAYDEYLSHKERTTIPGEAA